MQKIKSILLTVLLSLATTAMMAATTNPEAVTALLNRIGGSGTADRFVTIVDESLKSSGKDVFTITAQDGKPCIKGSSTLAVATGINWYLNHYAHVNLAWNHLTTDLSGVNLPVPASDETRTCHADYRYYLNYCTFSYSMSTWTWKRWQEEIDWMALHGINMPLQIVGLDVVWKRLLTEKYNYTEEDAVADLKLCYKKTALKMIVTYGPSIALAIVSVGCFVRSNNILKARNAALASTLAGVTKEFKKYRERVIAKYGKDADEEFRFGTNSVTVTDENGESKKINVVKETPKNGDYGPYARIFCEGNENWTGNPVFDKMFLEAQERYMNDRLVARGVVFLNDVYRTLGFDETPEGQMYGWVYKPGTDDANNVVDFGMRDFTKESSKNFWLGQADGVVLDFNIDGYILDKIPETF